LSTSVHPDTLKARVRDTATRRSGSDFELGDTTDGDLDRDVHADSAAQPGTGGRPGPAGAGSPAGERDPAGGLEFLRAGARPATATLIQFIDTHRASFGVERICRTLQIPPSTYYAAKSRPLSARARRDAELLADIRRVHLRSGGEFGARRVWQELRAEGIDVARCTVERLMRTAGLAGVSGNRKGGERHAAVEPVVQIGA
jgi:hypothetical protein